jgi:DNA invertase Pin-like site-specific DNA recombinase
MKKTAVAYYRTSSASGVGTDKDSLKRQQEAVTAYAKAHGVDIVQEYYDAAVSGADPVHERPGFAEMLTYIAGNGARMILCENASRFARDLAVQLTGHQMLLKLGYELVPVDAPDTFTDPSPTAVMVSQILGAVSQFEKASLVAKLKAARDRKKAETGKCGGRKSLAEINPQIVREARRLRRRSPRTGQRRSYAKISAELFSLGYWTAKGNSFSASQVKRITE